MGFFSVTFSWFEKYLSVSVCKRIGMHPAYRQWEEKNQEDTEYISTAIWQVSVPVQLWSLSFKIWWGQSQGKACRPQALAACGAPGALCVAGSSRESALPDPQAGTHNWSFMPGSAPLKHKGCSQQELRSFRGPRSWGQAAGGVSRPAWGGKSQLGNPY